MKKSDVTLSGAKCGAESRRALKGLKRFGLGRFLLFVTIVCVGFGLCYQRATRNSRAVQFLKSEDVHYRYFRNRNRINNHPEIKAPIWQRKLFGDEYFHKIRVLEMSGKQASSSAFWKQLRRHQRSLQYVEVIEIWSEGQPVSDDSTATMSLLSGLNAVYVIEGQVSSEWLSQCESLKNLSSLKIDSPPNSPIDFQSLARLNQTRIIVLDDCGLKLDDAEFLRDKLRSTMIVVVENNDSNIFN